MKHVGKMKNNNAKVAVAYRTLPGDSGSALVIDVGKLSDTWHDSLMNLVQDVSGQQANELADLLAVRKFPDGTTMLEGIHKRGLLIKVPTSGVIMTPSKQTQIALSELNAIIAEQKGVTIDELAITDGINPNPRSQQQPAKAPVAKDDPTRTTSSSVNAGEETVSQAPEVPVENLNPTQMRSRADKLFKEAQLLRKQADEIDPPKSKKKQVISEEA